MDLHDPIWIAGAAAVLMFVANIRIWIHTSRIARLMEELVDEGRPVRGKGGWPNAYRPPVPGPLRGPPPPSSHD